MCSGAFLVALGEGVVAQRDGRVKLVRRHDGKIVQTIPVVGSSPFLLIEGQKLNVETSKFIYTYELR